MKCGTKKMSTGGKTQDDKGLDKISPEARKMMEQKKKDMDQEKKQSAMEKDIYGKKLPVPDVRGSKYSKGGGVESKGKTKGKMVKMATGGSVGKASKRADGIATKGKTKCKVM